MCHGNAGEGAFRVGDRVTRGIGSDWVKPIADWDSGSYPVASKSPRSGRQQAPGSRQQWTLKPAQRAAAASFDRVLRAPASPASWV